MRKTLSFTSFTLTLIIKKKLGEIYDNFMHHVTQFVCIDYNFVWDRISVVQKTFAEAV